MHAEPIKKTSFAKQAKDKTKLNWFLYTFACRLYNELSNGSDLEWYRDQHDQDEVARFCTYFVGRMKESIYKRLAKITPVTEFYMEYAEEYYPSIRSDRCIDLLRAAMTAFDSLLDQCVVCPVRCISERNEQISLFDPMPTGSAFRFDSLAYCLKKKVCVATLSAVYVGIN